MATSREGLRERKNRRTRTAITRAALELAEEVGFERATVALIAERADVSPRTVHAWFPSKEDIIVGASELPLERLARELADGQGDVLDRIHRWIAAESSHTDHDELDRLRHRVLLADAHLRALQRGRQQGMEDLIAAAIARDVGQPPAAIGPRAIAAAVAASLVAMQERFAEDSDRDPDDVSFENVLPILRAALAALRDRG